MTDTARERRAKGVNLIELIKLLRVNRGAWNEDGLSDPARALLDTRIIVSAWYPFDAFVELLLRAHTQVFDGSDQAAIDMGILAGQLVFGGVHKAFIYEGEPNRSMEAFGRIWQSYFDFGDVRCKVADKSGAFEMIDYADVTRCHAHIVVGWGLALLGLSGVEEPEFRVLEAPWSGGATFRAELIWP